jgi:hypothetical protein
MPQRKPLGAIDANRKESRPTQRAQISAYKNAGLTYEQIGARIFTHPRLLRTPLIKIPYEMTINAVAALLYLRGMINA